MKIVVFTLLCLSSLTCTGLVSRKSEHWILDHALKRPCLRDIELEIIKEIEQGDFDNKITLMYAKGMTIRDIQGCIVEIYGAEISPTMISHKTERVITIAQELQSRPLDQVYLMVLFDAVYSKVKEGGKVVKKVAYTCFGILKDGEKEILGIWVGEAEGAKSWLRICSELKNRGVKKVCIACVDGLNGLSEEVKEAFPGVKIRRCIIHLIRQSMKYVPHKYAKDFISDLKNVYRAPTLQVAEENLLVLQEKWERRYPLAVAPWVENWNDVKTFFRLPGKIRKRIYTIGVVESLHRPFRKFIKN